MADDIRSNRTMGARRAASALAACAAVVGAGATPGMADSYSTAVYPAAVESGSAVAQVADPDAAAPLYAPEELDDLVGPIALYPDDLIAVVLPASTFPLQVVAAQRFLERREQDPAEQPDPEWDDSVVALLNYPDVLALMNDDLDWLGRLGDAVAYQQPDVLAAIARFRDRAYEAGNLHSDDHQTVSRPADVIEIAPADPEVIYVPYYEPERVIVYQSEPVYYYPRPCPVYYYDYPAGYWYDPFWPRSFWGVSLVFNIGWDSYHVHVRDHGYWRPAHYGHRHYYSGHDRGHGDWHGSHGRGHGDGDHGGHDNHGHGATAPHGTTTAAAPPPRGKGDTAGAQATRGAKPPRVRDLTGSTTRVAQEDARGRNYTTTPARTPVPATSRGMTTTRTTTPGHATNGSTQITRSTSASALQPAARAGATADDVRNALRSTRSTSAISLPQRPAPQAQSKAPARSAPPQSASAHAQSTPSPRPQISPPRQQITPVTHAAPAHSAPPQREPSTPSRVIARSSAPTPAPTAARSYSTSAVARSASSAHAAPTRAAPAAPARTQSAPARPADHGGDGGNARQSSRHGNGQDHAAQRK